jgi:syndecan 2
MKSSIFVITTLLLSIPFQVLAEEQNGLQNASRTSMPLTHLKKDEIYIDDEELEGSGQKGEIHDDLEKDTYDFSGSGNYDDDEDKHSLKPDDKFGKSNIHLNRDETIHRDRRPHTDDEEYTDYSGDGSNDPDDHDDDIVDEKHDDENRSRKIVPIHSEDDDDDDLYIENKPNSVLIETSSTDSGNTVSKNKGQDVYGNKDIEHVEPTQVTPVDHQPNLENAGNEVLILNTKGEERPTSFFAQPGILAAVIGGAVFGLCISILIVMFIVYRMRKKDEGSYALDEPKRSPTANSYAKNGNNREFYA